MKKGGKHNIITKKKISDALKGEKAYWYGKKHSEETKQKMKKAKIGYIPWNKGLGNRSTENEKARKNKICRTWKMTVLKRDNYTCMACGERGGILRVHHILNFHKYKKYRYVLDNGITLCNKCHIDFHKIYGKYDNNFEQIRKFINIDHNNTMTKDKWSPNDFRNKSTCVNWEEGFEIPELGKFKL